MKNLLVVLFTVLFAFQVSGQEQEKGKEQKAKNENYQKGKSDTSTMIAPVEPPPGGGDTYPWNRDKDGDGYGDPFDQVESETKPPGYVSNNSDCDDTDSSVYPGAPELADGKDNDCDGSIDEGIAAPSMPATPTITNYCGYTRLTRGTPPTGVTWYWQSTSSGTSTSNSSVYTDRTSGTVYYLRARNNSSALWSTAKTINYTIDACVQAPTNESFESGLGGWIQETGDTMEWTRRTGSTPSSSTGPSAAFNGSYYMYTESSGYNNKTAQLTSPTYNITSNLNFNFNYHMYGATMGSLTLQVSTNGGSSWAQVWTASGDKGNAWLSANVDLSEYQGIDLKIRFSAVTGSSYTSDISLDNFRFIPKTTSGCVTALSNENYVFTRVYKNKFTVPLTAPTTADVIEEVTYFDGLGRPMQQVGIRQAAGTGCEDIVTHIEYDEFGRQTKQYLPYPDANNPGTLKTGDVVLKTQTHYQANYATDFPGLTASGTNPYSETRFEASPLNRPMEQGAPGTAWKVNSTDDLDHTIKFGYQTNVGPNVTGNVRLFGVTLSSTDAPTLNNLSPYYYAAGELYKNVTKDENWTSGVNNTTEEFKDKQGRIVLKRTYNAGVEHDTYYVYDDYGNLTYVIPPKVITSDGVSATELSELSYQYRYDHRNRLIEKKIPGKGSQTNWESIVYNKLDQPIMTQDPNLKALNQWLFTKYDAFGRVVYTGLVGRSATRATLQAEADNNVAQFEERSSSRSLGGTSIYYTNNAYPKTYITEVHTEDYYDTYLASSAQAGINVPTTNTLGETVSTATKGLPTVSKVRVLGTSNWITTVTAYEQKGRPVWSKTVNSYLSTTNLVESDIDFTGNVLKTRTDHQRGTTAVVTTDNFTYDHVNRLKKHTQALNGNIEVIANNTYDKLGQLVSKGVGNTDGNSRLQTVDYAYNIRGWLKQINNPASLGTDLFGFKLNYNTPTTGTALYNGNISQTQWRTANTDNSLKTYTYTYDALNRLTMAVDNTGKFNLGNLSNPVKYDKNGNITNLYRMGHVVGSPILANNYGFGLMDNLTYTYDSGNKLLKVADAAAVDKYGFKDDAVNTATDSYNDYTYDANGNLTSDLNKGIGTSTLPGIKYNHLNMPTEIKFNNLSSRKINYTYSADGIKLRKITNNNGVITTADYAGSYVYENNILKQFYQPEGYVEPKGSSWQYVYQYKDIWGNTRITYADDDNSGSVTSAEIRREQNYYPFGLEHKGYNSSSYGVKNNLKTYQGQEFTEDLGLNTHEWKYRMSDPSIGRFWQIDPLAEDYTYNSTYAFQENKMGMGTELEGKELNPFGSARTISYYSSKIVGKTIQIAKDINSFLRTEGGGIYFTSDNAGNEDPGRKGGRDTDQVDADVLIQMAGYAGAKQKKVDNALDVLSSAIDGVDRVGNALEALSSNSNEKSTDSDTTVTATFAGEVKDFNPDIKGGLMELIRTDSTARMPKSEVNNFNMSAEKSIQNQVEKAKQIKHEEIDVNNGNGTY